MVDGTGDGQCSGLLKQGRVLAYNSPGQIGAGGDGSSMEQGNEAVAFFGQHFVSLGWLDRSPERSDENNGLGRPMAVSGFVFSVGDCWFLITAGHILENIDEARKKGQVLSGFHLIDGWSHERTYSCTIPFDFDEALKIPIYEKELGLDYGIIVLRKMHRDLLTSNGIKAIDEEGWKHNVDERFDSYIMLGIPSELTFILNHGGRSQIWDHCVIIYLTPTEAPARMRTERPRFYAKVPPNLTTTTDESITDLDGMSGSPIFGIKKCSGGQSRYWLVALQSSWMRSERVIAACLTINLGQAIERILPMIDA